MQPGQSAHCLLTFPPVKNIAFPAVRTGFENIGSPVILPDAQCAFSGGDQFFRRHPALLPDLGQQPVNQRQLRLIALIFLKYQQAFIRVAQDYASALSGSQDLHVILLQQSHRSIIHVPYLP